MADVDLSFVVDAIDSRTLYLNGPFYHSHRKSSPMQYTSVVFQLTHVLLIHILYMVYDAAHAVVAVFVGSDYHV